MARHVLALLLLMGGSVLARDGKISWMKFEAAMAAAGATGQPICVYVAVNPNGSS